MFQFSHTGAARRSTVEAIDEVAAAFDDVDGTVDALGERVDLLVQNQTTADTVICDHDRRIEQLSKDLQSLQEAVQRLTAAPPRDDSRRALLADGPRPSDIQAFLSASSRRAVSQAELLEAVRTVLWAMDGALTGDDEDSPRFPWSGPLLLLCSAPPDRLQAFVRRLQALAPDASLSVIGRERDRAVLARDWAGECTFHLYEAPGRFDRVHAPRIVPRAPFGGLVFLDGTGLRGERMEHCAALLESIQPGPVYCFGVDGGVRAVEPAGSAAQAASALLGWFHERVAQRP
jgi:hypothetical protein